MRWPCLSSLCPETFWPIVIESESQVDSSQIRVSISLMRTDGWKRKEVHKSALSLVKGLKWELIGHPPRQGCLWSFRHLVQNQTQSRCHLLPTLQLTGRPLTILGMKNSKTALKADPSREIVTISVTDEYPNTSSVKKCSFTHTPKNISGTDRRKLRERS